MTIRLTKEVYPAFCSMCNGIGCSDCHGTGDGPDATEFVWHCTTCRQSGEGEIVECPHCGDDVVTTLDADEDEPTAEDAFDAPDAADDTGWEREYC